MLLSIAACFLWVLNRFQFLYLHPRVLQFHAEKKNINKVCDFTDLGGFAPAPLVFVLKVFGCCSIVAGLKIARSCPQRARTTLRPDRQSPKYGEKLRPKNRPWGEKPRKIPWGYYIELWIFELAHPLRAQIFFAKSSV